MHSRRGYPAYDSVEEWALVAPYRTLLLETAPQREYSLREVFDGLREMMRYGETWCAMSHNLPPWHAVYDQAQHWLRADNFETLVHDLLAVLRLASGRTEEASAVVFDSRTLRPTPESGARPAWVGYKHT